jgi:membrane protease subunit HflK
VDVAVRIPAGWLLCPRGPPPAAAVFLGERIAAWLGLAGLILVIGYLGSGFYMVDTDEAAVTRRLGAVVATVGPGMHYRLPWPVDRVDVVKTTRVMNTGVGFALPKSEQARVAGIELLTGDTNILSIALALQYIIGDPADFLFRTEDPQALIGSIAETILTETVIGMPVDEVLTTGRLAIQERVRTGTQEVLNRYRTGIQITSANIWGISLDRSVADAFQDVTDALADRENTRNVARTYANNQVPKARGQAHALVREANASKQQRIAEAVGHTSRFLALLEEYEKAPDITRMRLYLEAVERVLPEVNLYVIDSEGGRVPVNLRVTNP